MNVIISESQYRTILNERYGGYFENIFKKYSNKVIKTIDNVKKQYGINIRFALTYGSAIGALIPSIESYLNGEFPELLPGQISGLAITAIFVVFFSSKDYFELKKKIENDGLGNELSAAVNKVETIKDKFSDMLRILGLSIYTLKDMVAYTFLLPVLGALNSVITTYGVSSIQFDTLIESILTSGLITTSGVVAKDILMNVANAIEKKKKSKQS